MRSLYFDFSLNNKILRLSYLENFISTNQETILFFHANGYSAQTYTKLLKEFIKNNYNVFALNFIGHNGSENYYDIKNWLIFSDQILMFIEYLKTKYNINKFHLVGHSLGGASSLLAGYFNNTNIFSISCWDPVVLTPFLSFFLNFIDTPLAKQAEKRREEFKNLEIIRRSYRMSDSFKNWDIEIFEDYLNSCFYFDESKNLYRLCLPKEIEAKIFRSLTFGNWKYYKKLRQTICVLAPKNSKVCPKRACKLLTKNNPNSRYEILSTKSHFFPMEIPLLTSQKTIEFIQKLVL
ncbi:MAG: alpha/beta fold hydrolase [Leptonema sp. (in: bacteria)]